MVVRGHAQGGVTTAGPTDGGRSAAKGGPGQFCPPVGKRAVPHVLGFVCFYEMQM